MADDAEVVRPRWLESTFREGVRRRPAMFVGDVGFRGLHYVVDEIVTTSLVCGSAKSVTVRLRENGAITISDDGSRLPAPLEEWLTNPAFPDFKQGTPQLRDPVWRMWAIAIANALSEHFRIESGDEHGVQEFRAGAALGPPITKEGDCQKGISVSFRPDPAIFRTPQFSSTALRRRLDELSLLHSGVSISFNDEGSSTSDEFRYECGIAEFLKDLNRERTPLHEALVFRGEEVGIAFEVGIQFCTEPDEIIRAYVNDRFCPDGGTHVTGVRIGLTSSLKNAVMSQQKFSAKDKGLTAVVSIRMDSPQWMGAKRSSLGTREARTVLASQVRKQMTDFFSANPDTARAIARMGNA